MSKIHQHFLFLLLLLGLSAFSPKQVYSQDSDLTIEDSLKNLLENAKADTLKMDLYNQLRRATWYTNPEKSKRYTSKYLEMAEIIGDSLRIAIANFYMGNANVVNGNPEKALSFYLKAANYFESKEDELSRLSSTYNGIASAYENNISDSLSLVYFEKSYEVSKLAEDKRRMGIALINRSNIYHRNGEFDKTIILLEEAVEILQEPKSAIYLKPAKINLAAAYVNNNNFEKAEAIYEKLIVEIDSVNDILNYTKTLGNYGLLFQQKNEHKKALTYIQNAYNKFLSNGFLKERYNIMPDLIDAHYKTGNHKKSIDLFYEYNTMKDSIFSVEKDKNLTEALQKYEAEKKDKALLDQQLVIEKENRQKNLILYIGIIVAIFLIILVIIFKKQVYYQKTIATQKESIQKQEMTELRQKNKLMVLNSMIEGQEAERLRIAKDLHDSLGGLLSSVKSHFTLIKNESRQLKNLGLAEKTNVLIDEACLEVRRISHNMMPHSLSLSGLKGAVEDLAENLKSLKYEVNLDIHNLPENIDNTKQITIYRLIQEILSNIRKHAEATSVLIQLFGHQDRLNLIIEDDGKGFDYDKKIADEGLGLKSINSRVEFLDGEIEWDSKPGNGTTITMNFLI
jgi:signal transduction histidine kinase